MDSVYQFVKRLLLFLWSLTLKENTGLEYVFENSILMRNYGPNKDENGE